MNMPLNKVDVRLQSASEVSTWDACTHSGAPEFQACVYFQVAGTPSHTWETQLELLALAGISPSWTRGRSALICFCL